MKNFINNITIRGLLAMLFAVALTGFALGQDGASRTEDPANNFADLLALRTPVDPVPVKDPEPVREPFQKRVSVTADGAGYRIVALQIPAGKRLVIENVSVVARCPEGRRMEVGYLTYLNNGAGVADRTVHRLALRPTGSINSTAIFTANRRERVSADERIGAEHFSVGVSARLINGATGAGQAQFIFSGYLEELPAAK
jgi:hypothetical protein